MYCRVLALKQIIILNGHFTAGICIRRQNQTEFFTDAPVAGNLFDLYLSDLMFFGKKKSDDIETSMKAGPNCIYFLFDLQSLFVQSAQKVTTVKAILTGWLFVIEKK